MWLWTLPSESRPMKWSGSPEARTVAMASCQVPPR